MERDQAFLEYVVKALVDHPEEVVIGRSVDEMGVLLTLTASVVQWFAGSSIGSWTKNFRAPPVGVAIAPPSVAPTPTPEQGPEPEGCGARVAGFDDEGVLGDIRCVCHGPFPFLAGISKKGRRVNGMT
jgi:hypothetical protein